MSDDNVPERLIALISRAMPGSLCPEQKEWLPINPKWTMVARLFVHMLEDEDVLPRLTQARTIADLKAVLFVDYYLSRIRAPGPRRQIREMISNPEVALDTIAVFAARSFAEEIPC